MNHTSVNRQHRPGFTLLELLMVVAIIGFLMGLSVVVLYGVTDSANDQATTATIRKLDALVQERTEAFEKAFNRQGAFRQRYINATNAILQQKFIYGVRPEVVETLAKKVAYRHQFPQRHEDLLKLDFDTDGSTPLTAFDGDTIFPAGSRGPLDANDNQIPDLVEGTAADPTKLPTVDAAVRDETVSSELLYYTLVHSGNFGSSTTVADQFSAAEVADTDDDGLLEFVDAYGSPLQFYRWPTRLMDPDVTATFEPNLANLNDDTDIRQTVESPAGSGTFVTVGVRQITPNERNVARLLLKGLPPSSIELPNGVLPRDMMFIDPDDPIGRIYSEMEKLDGLDNRPKLASEFNEIWYHTPDTYHTALIVSAGPDEELGLYHAADTANLGNLAQYDFSAGFDTMIEQIGDNITNRNRRAGGRR